MNALKINSSHSFGQIGLKEDQSIHELFRADKASFVVAEMTASEAFGK